MSDDLSKRAQPDRSKIAMGEAHEVSYWSKHLGVTCEELRRNYRQLGRNGAKQLKACS